MKAEELAELVDPGLLADLLSVHRSWSELTTMTNGRDDFTADQHEIQRRGNLLREAALKYQLEKENK